MENLAKELQGCEVRGDCQIVRDKYQAISDANSARAKNCQQTGDCQQIAEEIQGGQRAMDQLHGYADQVVNEQFENQQHIDRNTVSSNIIAEGYKRYNEDANRQKEENRQALEELQKDPIAFKQLQNAQAAELARQDLEQQVASQGDQLRDKLANDAALRAEVGDLLDYQQRLAGAAANVAGGAKIIGEMLEPTVWDLLSPAAKAVKLSMIVAAMKGGAAEFKIGSQVAGELATIEQLSGKLNDLNAGKLPGEAELSKYYDKTPLGQAISEANKTGFGGAKATDRPSSGAESAINQGRLNSQLLAEEVASGHAFQKHVVERQEFADLGISTKSQFQSFVEGIVSNPAIERRQAVDGTVYYLDDSTKTIVIRGQRGEATAFRPDKGGVGWENYIKSQVPKK
ncbi:hypothetical protein [Pseudomonas oryzihabitans]|uniref:hypothetical protein n=1 Tax=Pseudomonas oryzihabitans TaxID=47885 RepID=UPI001239A0DF|nr:hypothetical protein [Pseudomonas oryzihabitans]QEU05347.1 hypothetical protein FOB65_19245 [Pseudomonas oryzihabitans]